MSGVPPYLTTADIAKACGMQTHRARRLVKRAGIAERLGDTWVVSESRLRERLPDVYDRVFALFAMGDTEEH